MLEIGKTVYLEVIRTLPIGLILGDGEYEVLLPARYAPDDIEIGERIEVFLYTDSEDRPIATTQTPLVQADEFASLRVVSIASSGAFLDWGLPKDLLLPFRSQLHPVRPEEQVVVRVFVDPISGRPVATTKLQRFLEPTPVDLREGQIVDWMIYEETELGSKALVNGLFEGLFYREVGAQSPMTGSTGTGYVQQIRSDGKVDLTLRPSGQDAIDNAADRVLEALRRSGGRLGLNDRSTPEEIKRQLGLSKKAFKRAVGALYRQRQIQIRDDSIELVAVRADKTKRPAT